MQTQDEKLEDGLYTARQGRLQKIEIDPDDTTKKLRVAEVIFELVKEVQKSMRSGMGGRKPDLHLVAEALILIGADADDVEVKIRDYCVKVFAGV